MMMTLLLIFLLISEVMQIVVACYIDYGISTVMLKGVESVVL